MLSKELLETMAQQGQGSRSFCASYRVKVYTVNGVQIGLPGVGEGVHRLTFPAGYVIKDAMNAPTWIRFATDKEIAEETPAGFQPRWWRELDFTPRAFVYSDGTTAFENQPIGLRGDTVQALAQEMMYPEPKPCIDVSGIETPSSGIETPPTP